MLRPAELDRRQKSPERSKWVGEVHVGGTFLNEKISRRQQGNKVLHIPADRAREAQIQGCTNTQVLKLIKCITAYILNPVCLCPWPATYSTVVYVYTCSTCTCACAQCGHVHVCLNIHVGMSVVCLDVYVYTYIHPDFDAQIHTVYL